MNGMIITYGKKTPVVCGKKLCDVCETKVLRICWILGFCGNSLGWTSIFLVHIIPTRSYFLFIAESFISFACKYCSGWNACMMLGKWFICSVRAVAHSLGHDTNWYKYDLCINVMWYECIYACTIIPIKYIWENFCRNKKIIRINL